MDFAAVDLWDGKRMFEMPSVTSISHFPVALCWESRGQGQGSGHWTHGTSLALHSWNCPTAACVGVLFVSPWV